MRLPLPSVFLLPILLLAHIGRAAEPQHVSFQRDVMAVLSKSGCNLGTCHGNKFGKGGFQLSLRGDRPREDFQTLTRTLRGRRVNPMNPSASLLLLKPTMQVPHQGGRRFRESDPEYQILRDWIAAGMPQDPEDLPSLVSLTVTPQEVILREPEESFQIRVEAEFADGEKRDVTRLAVYEPAMPIVAIASDGKVTREKYGETSITVRYLQTKRAVRVVMIPAREEFVWNGLRPNNFIDKAVFAKLKMLRVNPSPACDDSTFLRRAFLDLLGIPPTAEEAKQFVYDSSPGKRARLIDSLLARPEFADRWALLWSDLLRNEEKTLDPKGVRNFHAWLRTSFNENKPFDRLVRELISARGSTYQNPPANYYRAMRDPVMRAESTAQLFLGVRLQCAKCHNHPFDRWTQNDYYSWTNFFSGIDYRILSNNRYDDNDKHQFDGEQLVVFNRKLDVKHPDSGQTMPPSVLGDQPVEIDNQSRRLDKLAEWVTSAGNRRFRESQANRIWSQVMGTGIVDPIDDFRDTNPASHPELLTRLGLEFADSGFDLKHLLRLILNSQTYQLSSQPTAENGGAARNFAHAANSRLSAEVMLDAFSVALQTDVAFTNQPAGLRAGQMPGVRSLETRYQKPSRGDQFLSVFGKPPRLQSCECERSDETTLKQAFQLLSGDLLQELIERDGNLLDRVLKSGNDAGQQIEALYWQLVSRPPGEEELAKMREYLKQQPNRRHGLEDIAWALLTSNEFLLRH